MESQFRRLALLAAVVSFLGFGVASAWSFYRANSTQDIVSMYYQQLNSSIAECEKDRTSVYCEMRASNKDEFDSAVVERNQYSSRAETFLVAALVVPIISLFMFFAGRWIATGRRPAWLLRRQVKSSADS